MDRTVPSTENEEIELYIRTYFSLLRSSAPVRIKALEETHAGMRSSLHAKAESPMPDVAAFTYAYLRLPSVIKETRLVMLGQSEEVFARRGYHNVHRWQLVEAPARRRLMFYDGQGTLAAFIASVSDIDDLVPLLTAFQIEWNKMHTLLSLNRSVVRRLERTVQSGAWLQEDQQALRDLFELDASAWQQLERLFGKRLAVTLLEIASRPQDVQVILLASSLTDYRRATQGWWRRVEAEVGQEVLEQRPVYFVSSNTHSLLNVLSGFAPAYQEEIGAFLNAANPEGLSDLLRQLDQDDPERLNVLYYGLRHALKADRNGHLTRLYREWYRAQGFIHIDNPMYLDVAVQIFPLNRLDADRVDPRVRTPALDALHRSDALIFNVDYPLGMAAYQVLSEVSSRTGDIRGVYIMGKAATLNGRIGDVMIPNVVYDEHSRNSYLFRNCFAAMDVTPFMLRHSVLDNQKAVTVRGTFLQNRHFMRVFYQEGYTDLEMEAGPYLSAVYENNYPKRYPVDEIVNLYSNVRYDVGILHYASDTPYSKRQALLAESLAYQGVEATYATSIAILRRIFEVEAARLRRG
ncbi:MAG: hypothetical protein Q9O62_15360 [Ardenticatenia bacterium]|nr:hypothetical protein [Ardenticatenia bacterium]